MRLRESGSNFTHQAVYLVTTQELSVRAAMQIALSGDLHPALRGSEMASKAGARAESYPNTLAPNEAFAESIRNAVQDGNKELIEEMRLLRASLESNSSLNYNLGASISAEKPANRSLVSFKDTCLHDKLLKLL